MKPQPPDPNDLLAALEFTLAFRRRRRGDAEAYGPADEAWCADLWRTLAVLPRTPNWERYPAATAFYRQWVERSGRE